MQIARKPGDSECGAAPTSFLQPIFLNHHHKKTNCPYRLISLKPLFQPMLAQSHVQSNAMIIQRIDKTMIGVGLSWAGPFTMVVKPHYRRKGDSHQYSPQEYARGFGMDPQSHDLPHSQRMPKPPPRPIGKAKRAVCYGQRQPFLCEIPEPPALVPPLGR